MLPRRYFRALFRSLLLCSEGLMPKPREGQKQRPLRSGATFAIMAAAVLAATPASAQTLTEAFAYTYNNNPQILAQRALLRSTDEQVPQALANWRPTVTLTGTAGFERAGVAARGTSTQFSSFEPRAADLRITQPLYRGGRTEAQTRQAINTVQANRAQTRSEGNRNKEQGLRRQLEATQDRFRVGEVTRTDVAQAESQLAQATAQRINAEGQLEVSRANYARAVGHPPGRLVQPRERPVLPATRDEALALAASNNPNVISAMFAELAARDNIDLVRGQLLPTINLIGDLSRSFAPSVIQQSTRQDTASAVLQLTMPLYEGGAIWSQTRAAEQTVGQRRGQLDDARRLAVQQATQAWETLQSARAAITSFGAAVRAAQSAIEGIQQEALVGSRTVLDVLISERKLFTTQSQLVGAQHDSALAEFNLAAAMGRLIAPELRLPVQLYDMERHYRAVKYKWLDFCGGQKGQLG